MNSLAANDSVILSRRNIRQQRRSMGTRKPKKSGPWSSKDYPFSSMNIPLWLLKSPWTGWMMRKTSLFKHSKKWQSQGTLALVVPTYPRPSKHQLSQGERVKGRYSYVWLMRCKWICMRLQAPCAICFSRQTKSLMLCCSWQCCQQTLMPYRGEAIMVI